MNKRFSLPVFIVLLSMALPSTATAQERKGFWFSFGLGKGSIGISAADAAATLVSSDRSSVGVLDIGLGWAVKQQLLVGIEVNASPATLTNRRTGTIGSTNVSGTITYYPRSSSNFFVEGGVGGSFFKVASDAAGYSPEVGAGFGFTVAAGYDIYLARGFSLTPAVGFWYGQPGDLREGGQTMLKNWRHNVFDVTLSIKFN
jgi:hypothetical protein